MTDKGRLPIDGTAHKSRTVVGFASGKGHDTSARDSAHDFILEFSPSACVAVVASLIEEMAAQIFAYPAHGTADSDKSHGLCAMTKY